MLKKISEAEERRRTFIYSAQNHMEIFFFSANFRQCNIFRGYSVVLVQLIYYYYYYYYYYYHYITITFISIHAGLKGNYKSILKYYIEKYS